MELSELRRKMEEVDGALLPLFLKRMELSRQIAFEKEKGGLPVQNSQREQEILKIVAKKSGDLFEYSERLFLCLFTLSKEYQETLLKKKNGNLFSSLEE